MIALAIVLVLLVLIALLPVGAAAEYGEDGLRIWLLAGPVRRQIVPAPEKKKKSGGKTVIKKPAARKIASGTRRGGGLPPLTQLLKLAAQALGALRRKIWVRDLTLRVTYGGTEPAQTAIRYGEACAAAHALWPLFAQLFRVRRQDVRIVYDPEETSIGVYAHAAMTLRVGSVLALAARFGARALVLFGGGKKDKKSEDKAVSE